MCFIAALYRKLVVKRYDETPLIPTFELGYFEGLKAEPVSFVTDNGITVNGNFYSYEGAREDMLVIFCHGIGGGQKRYYREIDTLARHGYRVLAYDDVGCDTSEGKDIRGLSESLHDLFSCMNYLRSLPEYKDIKICVAGHSWGGYAAGNILNYRDDIEAVAVISGFTSVDDFMRVYYKGKAGFVRKRISAFERKANPMFADSSSVNAAENTGARMLFIHSDDDEMVKMDCGMGLVSSKVTRDNIEYLLFDGRKHTPHYQKEATEYLTSFMNTFYRKVRSGELKNYDLQVDYMKRLDLVKATNQDGEVWKKIFDCFDRS